MLHLQECQSICDMLDLALEFSAADLRVTESSRGLRTGLPLGRGSRRSLVARTEGLLLDPVYSGKAFAGLREHVRQGDWGSEDTLVFVHTGGAPALFAYGTEFESLCD